MFKYKFESLHWNTTIYPHLLIRTEMEFLIDIENLRSIVICVLSSIKRFFDFAVSQKKFGASNHPIWQDTCLATYRIREAVHRIVASHLDGGDRGANPNQSLVRPPPPNPDSVIALKSFEKIPPGDKSSRRRRGLLNSRAE